MCDNNSEMQPSIEKPNQFNKTTDYEKFTTGIAGMLNMVNR